MWVEDQDRLLTYRKFCCLFQNPGHRVWLDRLIWFHLETAGGGKRERAGRLDHRDPGTFRLPGPMRRRWPLGTTTTATPISNRSDRLPGQVTTNMAPAGRLADAVPVTVLINDSSAADIAAA